MRIGQLSEQTNCKIETIRYYEKISLLPEPLRSQGGYRIYDEAHLRRLVFVRRSRELGFSIEEIRSFIKHVAAGRYLTRDLQTITTDQM